MDRININGVEYYRLYCKCPVCVERGIETEPVFWRHELCGGDMYVGADAYLMCERDGSRAHVTNWEFHCPNCSHSDDNYVMARRSFEIVCPTPLPYMSDAIDLAWIREFLKNI